MNSPEILVAEDDESDYILLLDLLTEAFGAGVRPVHAADGEDMLETLWRHRDSGLKPLRPDHILLDWHMPRVTGLDALMILRSQAELRTIPVLIVTGGLSPDDAQIARSAGAAGILRKPGSDAERRIAIEVLRAAIRRPASPKRR